ncbi:MAG TPA: hypothetical protein VGI39_05165 [Polyangiaceae bacterium]
MNEGPGYQAGDFEIHPGIAAEVGYDSNYLIRSDKTGPASGTLQNGAPLYPPVDTGLLRVTPSISLTSVPSAKHTEGAAPAAPPPVTFSAGASGTYREFFNSALQNQRNMSAQANATLAILPGRAWGGAINAAYTRTIQPTVFGSPDISYNNDVVVGGVDLAAQPGAGTLDWHFGYTFTGTFFEDSGGKPYNNLLNTFYTRGRWRFRPRTALLYDGSIAARSFSDATNAEFVQHSGLPTRARLGLEGLVTPRFSILAMAGYGGTFTEKNTNADTSVRQYDSVIGQLELRFYPGGGGGTPGATDTPSKTSLLVSAIALGYNRDFIASYLNGYVGIDRGYLRAEYFFAGRFLVTLEGGVGALEHPTQFSQPQAGGVPTQLTSGSYTDVGANATVFAEYRVRESLGINATFNYNENFSNTTIPFTNTAGGIDASGKYYDLNYRRFQAFIGVRWFM